MLLYYVTIYYIINKIITIRIIIIFVETRLQNTIRKIIKYRLLNRLPNNLVTFESSPLGSMANRADLFFFKVGELDKDIDIINLELWTLIIKKLLRLVCLEVAFYLFFECKLGSVIFK